jgi:hypothetical protein
MAVMPCSKRHEPVDLCLAQELLPFRQAASWKAMQWVSANVDSHFQNPTSASPRCGHGTADLFVALSGTMLFCLLLTESMTFRFSWVRNRRAPSCDGFNLLRTVLERRCPTRLQEGNAFGARADGKDPWPVRQPCR